MEPLDPRFEEWLAQQQGMTQAAAAAPRDPTAGLAEAFEADRADRLHRERLQHVFNASGIIGGRPPIKVDGSSGDAVKEWVMSRRVEQDAQRAGVDEEWKRAQAERMRQPRTPSMAADNPDNEEAPEEWGAPPGMTKRQAIQGGWAKKPAPPRAPAAPRPVNTAAAAREERASARATYGGKYFRLRSDVPPGSLDEVELRKIRDASGEIADLANKADEVVSIYQRAGGGELTGPDAARMRSIITDMQLTAKGPNVYALGVLAGPDMEILNTLLTNPGKLNSIFRNAASLRDFVTEIQTFKRGIVERTVAKADALGFDAIEGIGGPFLAKRKGAASKPSSPSTDPLGIR